MFYHTNLISTAYTCILLCRTKLSWLEDQKYWYKDDLQHLKESLIITEDEYEVLRRFHKNTKFFCYKPSYTDKLRLAQAYHDCKLNIQLHNVILLYISYLANVFDDL